MHASTGRTCPQTSQFAHCLWERAFKGKVVSSSHKPMIYFNFLGHLNKVSLRIARLNTLLSHRAVNWLLDLNHQHQYSKSVYLHPELSTTPFCITDTMSRCFILPRNLNAARHKGPRRASNPRPPGYKECNHLGYSPGQVANAHALCSAVQGCQLEIENTRMKNHMDECQESPVSSAC